MAFSCRHRHLSVCLVSTAAVLGTLGTALCPKAALAQEAKGIASGGFENGTDGWMWEQWLGKPLPGALDRTDHAEGAASFKMGLAGAEGGRWLAKEFLVQKPGQDHTFAFQWKLQGVPDGAARVRLAIPNKGFLGGGDLVRAGGTQGWKAYRFTVPGSLLEGVDKVTVFFYHDQIGSGVIGIDGVSLQVGAAPPDENAAVTLIGDTSRPDISTFAAGKPVELTFAVAGLKPSAVVTLNLTVTDEHDQPIETRKIPVQPDAAGHWQTKITAPSQRLGFYRVRAALSNGVDLSAVGTRAAGYLTYAVVPDPAKRIDYGEKGSRFGMQGGFGPWASEALSLLGARWVLDGGLEWRKQEPDHTGQFGTEQARQYAAPSAPQAPAWHEYTLPTLFNAPAWATVPSTFAYMTGTLTPKGEKGWAAYCAAAAHAYAAKNPDRKEHIYQITWEPISPWGFKGTDADLVRIYEIAYRALHAADPHAVVAGPTRGINNDDPKQQARLFALGLGRCLDGYTVHPYFSITPEREGMVGELRAVQALLRDATKRNLPLFGTEQGWSTEESPDRELEQARGLLRQNLIMLGEGYRFNFAFYIADYRLSGQKGYGYYYNLDPTIPFGPRKISPRPIVPAYAAQSMLLDGSTSAGPIEGLGDGIQGYAFERPNARVLALWNYGPKPRRVSLSTGAPRVQIFDWMGNEHNAATSAGRLDLTLGPEPVYVTGVSPRLWGTSAANLLVVAAKRFDAYSGGRITISGTSQMPSGKPLSGRIVLDADPAAGLPAVSRPITLGATYPASFRLPLDVPATANPGSRTLHLRLCDAAGNTLKAATLPLRILAPLAIRTEAGFTSGGKPALTVTLKDSKGRGADGRLEIHLKELLPAALRSDAPMIDLVRDPGKTREVAGADRSVVLRVPPGGSQRLVVPLPETAIEPARRYQALITVTTKSGIRFSETAPVVLLGAARLARPATIDGALSEWASITPVALQGQEAVVRSPQDYPPGLSATLRYAWDDQALYVAAEVSDTAFFQSYTGADLWRQDCLQLAFDLDPKGATSGAHRASEINVALTKSGPQAFRGFSYATDRLPVGLLSPEEITVAVRRSGPGGLLYEMAIPWKTLGRTGGQPFKAGDSIGVAATVNEVRSADQGDPCALGLFGGITPAKNPESYGILTLK